MAVCALITMVVIKARGTNLLNGNYLQEPKTCTFMVLKILCLFSELLFLQAFSERFLAYYYSVLNNSLLDHSLANPEAVL